MTKAVARPMRALRPGPMAAPAGAIAGQGAPGPGSRLAAWARRKVNANTSPQAGDVTAGRTQRVPNAQIYTGYDKDQDTNGTALPATMDHLYGLALTPFAGSGGDRYGMKGSPANSYRGDLGPLQIVEPVAVGAAPRGVRSGMGSATALPGSNGPGGQVTVQDLLGIAPV